MAATKSMAQLSIINSQNFTSGAVKRPSAANLAAIASGVPAESLFPVFKALGYSIRLGKFTSEEIILLVMDHTKKDKETGKSVVTGINQIVTLRLDAFKAWQADTLFSSSQSAKLVTTAAKKLFDYPVFTLGELGLYPKENTVALLASLLSAKFDLNDDNKTAIAMAAYVADRSVLRTEPLSKIVGYIETEAIRNIRRIEHETKQAAKQLAAAKQQDDQF